MRHMLLVAAVAALLVAPLARAWTWPSDGAVLQAFSFDPAHPYAAGQHRGIDIAGSAGAAVVAPAGGTVSPPSRGGPANVSAVLSCGLRRRVAYSRKERPNGSPAVSRPARTNRNPGF